MLMWVPIIPILKDISLRDHWIIAITMPIMDNILLWMTLKLIIIIHLHWYLVPKLLWQRQRRQGLANEQGTELDGLGELEMVHDLIQALYLRSIINLSHILQMRLTNSEGYNIKDLNFFSQFQNKTYPGYKKSSAASWNMQGNLLATGQSSLKLWGFDPQAGLELIVETRGIEASINQIKFYGQNVLATLNRDTLKLWDVRQSIKPIKAQKKNKADILTFAWNHDTTAPQFAVLSKDNIVSMYDIRNLVSLNNPVCSDKNKNDITEIEWDRSGSVLFCAGGDSSSSVLMMYTPTLELISEIVSPHNSKINSLAVDPTNSYLATCSDDSLACINSLPDIICQRTYSHTDCVIRKVAFSHNAEYLAVSCEQPKIESTSNKGEEVKVVVEEPCIDLYNVATGGHAYRIRCGNTQQVLEWHPRKPILAYFDYDEEDKKKPGSEREQRYLHIFGI